MHCHLAVVMAAMSNAIEMHLAATTASAGNFRCSTAPAHVLLLSYLRGRRPHGADARLRSRRLPRSHPARQAHRLRRPAADVSGDPRSSAAREYDLSSLHTCIYTMAPMGRPLLERGIAELCPNFVLSSGQTEMYPATTMSQPDRQLERFGNYWGESLIVNDTAIMDDDGNLLPRGEIGELVHRGPNVMMGYYKDPKATEDARKFGWHHTGDLALIDEHGEVLFLDRKKDMIKSGGENVASVKIEETLLAHPAVHERRRRRPAASGMGRGGVGLRHAEAGRAGGSSRDHRALPQISSAASRCRSWSRILDAMPMTATGKLRKVELRQALSANILPGQREVRGASA